MNLLDVKINVEDIQNAMVMLGKIDDEIMTGEGVTPEKVQELLLAAITTKLIRRNPPGFKINQLDVEGTVEGEPFGIKIQGLIKAQLIREEKRK
jgi:hypothetical protein